MDPIDSPLVTRESRNKLARPPLLRDRLMRRRTTGHTQADEPEPVSRQFTTSSPAADSQSSQDDTPGVSRIEQDGTEESPHSPSSSRYRMKSVNVPP